MVSPNILLLDEPFSALDVLTTLRTDLLDLEGRHLSVFGDVAGDAVGAPQ